MSDSLNRSIYISLAAHMGLFAVFFLKMTFFPVEPIQIKRSIRVDLVGMPDKVMPAKPTPAKPAPKVEAPKPATKEPPKVAKKTAPKTPPKKKADSKKISNSQESAMNKLKAMAALDKIKSESEQKQADQIKGNEVSKGNSLTGLEQLDYDRYFDDVEQLIYSNWALPEWLAGADLRAQALVLVDQSGHITNKKITKSSGNPDFDAQVLTAIEKSSPFPAPPERLQRVLAQQGIIFNFPD